MTDGIGRIFGGNSYGIGGYVPQRKEEAPQEEVQQAPVSNYEETQVDPSKIMDFMASNNYFVAPTTTAAPKEADPELTSRVSGYMENFEMIYGVIVEEFGEESAPAVMDYVMDHLMGMAA
jgi:hypothetical protein